MIFRTVVQQLKISTDLRARAVSAAAELLVRVSSMVMEMGRIRVKVRVSCRYSPQADSGR